MISNFKFSYFSFRSDIVAYKKLLWHTGTLDTVVLSHMCGHLDQFLEDFNELQVLNNWYYITNNHFRIMLIVFQFFLNSYTQMIMFQVYKKPGCSSDGYKELYMKNKKVFNSQQLFALRELYSWRDETARMEDESYGQVTVEDIKYEIYSFMKYYTQGNIYNSY